MLIELCGVDGSGKSTLATLLKGHFVSIGRNCFVRGFKSSYRQLMSTIAADLQMSRSEAFGADAVEIASAMEFLDRGGLLYAHASTGKDIYIADRYAISLLGMAIARGASRTSVLTALYRMASPPRHSFHLRIESQIAHHRALARKDSDIWVANGGVEWIRDFDAGLRQAMEVVDYETIVLDSGRLSPAELLTAVCEEIDKA
jgi:thymidylate kinase